MAEAHDLQPKEPKRKQRRVAPRRQPKGSTKVICRKGSLGLGPNLAFSVLDVSEGGARLILKEELRRPQEVEVSLSCPSILRDIVRKGTVVWSVPTADGKFCVGVQFEKRLEYATLHDLSRHTHA